MRRRLRVWNVFGLTPELLLALGAVLFCAGLLVGFLLANRLNAAVPVEQVGLLPTTVTWLRFWTVFWHQYRWLLLSGVLALSALGVFLLYPLTLLRGFVLGFSFTALFASENRTVVLVHFLLTALLTCGPLLLLTVSGMLRGLSELHRPQPEQYRSFGRIGMLAGVILAGTVLAFLCCALQLWLLPGLLARA